MAGFNTVDRNGFRSSDIAMLMLEFLRTRELRASIHRCVSRCAVYACSLIIVLIATLVTIQMFHIAKSGATGAWHVVNRAGKHNRLPSGHAFDQNAGNEQRNSDVLRTVPADRELLDGSSRWPARSLIFNWLGSRVVAFRDGLGRRVQRPFRLKAGNLQIHL